MCTGSVMHCTQLGVQNLQQVTIRLSGRVQVVGMVCFYMGRVEWSCWCITTCIYLQHQLYFPQLMSMAHGKQLHLGVITCRYHHNRQRQENPPRHCEFMRFLVNYQGAGHLLEFQGIGIADVLVEHLKQCHCQMEGNCRSFSTD